MEVLEECLTLINNGFDYIKNLDIIILLTAIFINEPLYEYNLFNTVTLDKKSPLEESILTKVKKGII